MTTDARLSVERARHPKTKKLIRRLGFEGAWGLVCLFLWTASNRPDGDLSGMTHEDVELAIYWLGEPGHLVAALLGIGFLDSTETGLKVHEWQEHNPWAFGQGLRSAKARWNAIKRYHGEAEADRQVPQYAAAKRAALDTACELSTANSSASTTASSTKGAMHLVKDSNTRFPNLSPYPITPAQQTAAAKWVEDEVSLVNRACDLRDITPEVRDAKIAVILEKSRERNAQAVSA